MRKDTAIELLARITAEGFSSIEDQLLNLENRIEVLEMYKDVSEKNIHKRIDKIVMPNLDTLARRIKDLELKARKKIKKQ